MADPTDLDALVARLRMSHAGCRAANEHCDAAQLLDALDALRDAQVSHDLIERELRASLDGCAQRVAQVAAERDALRAVVRELHGQMWRIVREHVNEVDALRADLARVTAERDELYRIRNLLVRALVRATGATETEVREAPMGCASRADAQRDAAVAVVEAVSGQPWPLLDVVERLRLWASHALNDHNCDCHGHEEVRAAIEAAGQLAPVLRAALAASTAGAPSTPADAGAKEPV